MKVIILFILMMIYILLKIITIIHFIQKCYYLIIQTQVLLGIALFLVDDWRIYNTYIIGSTYERNENTGEIIFKTVSNNAIMSKDITVVQYITIVFLGLL